MIDVKCFTVGLLSTNCYLVTDIKTGETALIDPGAPSRELDKALSGIDSDKVKYILLTHGHYDHISYVSKLSRRLSCRVVISEKDEPFITDHDLNLSAMFCKSGVESFGADITLSDGDKLLLGETEFEFIGTPGHTAGSGCYLFADDGVIFSGDTLFRCSFGRTDFPTGNMSMLAESLRRLAALSGDYRVYPGHGDFTTMSYERDNNPCMVFLKDH